MSLSWAKDLSIPKAHTGSGTKAASCSLGTRTTQIKKLSDSAIRREDEMYRGARRGRRKRYEFFEWLTFVRPVKGLIVNIGRVKEKGSEARNTLEGSERERTLWIASNNPKD
jgi:hypothetical protein